MHPLSLSTLLLAASTAVTSLTLPTPATPEDKFALALARLISTSARPPRANWGSTHRIDRRSSGSSWSAGGEEEEEDKSAVIPIIFRIMTQMITKGISGTGLKDMDENQLRIARLRADGRGTGIPAGGANKAI
ncbi:hypothetical protein BJ508DRAFT_416705 [Ascobolus immersus RN42]|uniref:Uncharacterized protein n=1 Tax=Ascobolus immersus RN42 TaxID=1160509 RepID=A0A3N4HY31_ASCIM|nr:hypothetical protein BJ508DRAFT_416705 [Ascobolus immersus RN42]